MKKITSLIFILVAAAICVSLVKYLPGPKAAGLDTRSFLDAAEQLADQNGVLEIVGDAVGEIRQAAEPADEPEGKFGPYEVIRVIDGDTIAVDVNGDGEADRVRLIGIDTPESVNQVNPEKNCEEGVLASQFTKKLLEGKSVYLEYDVQRMDDYGRTLAYVFLDDTETMVQDEILKAGFATTLTITPNVKYADHFYDLLQAARENQAGLWRSDFFSDY